MKKRPNAQHKALRLGIFQPKVVKAKKGTGSFARHNKYKKGDTHEPYTS